MGYDVGFIKDDYGCNSNKCECAHFADTVIGKLFFHWHFNGNLHSGDIAVSRKTVHKLMEINGDSNAAFWKAYPKSNIGLWNQTVVNEEYVIAYELSPGLDHKLQNMLPKVSSRLFLKQIEISHSYQIESV